MVYLITYDLHRLKNYDFLHERIQKLGNCIRPLESFWLVDTSLDIHRLNDYIGASVDRDDNYYITTISNTGVGKLTTMDDWKWINSKFILPKQPLARGTNPLQGLGKLPRR
jgi:hypothetical protein